MIKKKMKKNREEKKMGEGEKKKRNATGTRTGEEKKMAPLLCFRFPSGTGTPSNSKQASRLAGRQAKDIKTIGRCRDLPPSPSVPFKICKYTSEVRIYSSLSNRARLLFTRLELDSTA